MSSPLPGAAGTSYDQRFQNARQKAKLAALGGGNKAAEATLQPHQTKDQNLDTLRNVAKSTGRAPQAPPQTASGAPPQPPVGTPVQGPNQVTGGPPAPGSGAEGGPSGGAPDGPPPEDPQEVMAGVVALNRTLRSPMMMDAATKAQISSYFKAEPMELNGAKAVFSVDGMNKRDSG